MPWPLDTGGHLRTYHLARGLARRFDLILVTGVDRVDTPGIARLREDGINVCPAILPPRGKVGEALRALNARLSGRPYVFFARHDRRPVWRALRRELSERRPDLFFFDHLDSLLFSRLAGDLPFAIDCHNVYSTLVRRQAEEGHRGLARRYLLGEARRLERVERQAAGTARLLFAVSAEDLEIFNRFGAHNAHVVPNGVDCAFYASIPPERPDSAPLLLYVGTMSWPPNANAVVFLAREALPRIRTKCPAARLRIIGRDPLPAVRELAALPGVEVTGGVDDVRPHLSEAHALAVPLETGGGSRLKILEAFAAGLPVVSTPVGCEGLEVSNGVHLTVARREEFADAVVGLLQNRSTAAARAAEARRLVVDRYDWKAVADSAAKLLSAVVGCK